MRGIFIIFAVVVSALLLGCGAGGTGPGGQRASIYFINDFNREVEVTIEGCDAFKLAPRQQGGAAKYTARCDFTENPLFTIHVKAKWVIQEGNPPVYKERTEVATAKSGDAVYIRPTLNEFHVVVEESGG